MNTNTSVDKPRAYTADELRDTLLESLRENAKYWAALPGKTPLEIANGVTFSLLTLLDGCSILPSFDLVVRPHPDDKQFNVDEGNNYYEDGTAISDMLHERFYAR